MCVPRPIVDWPVPRPDYVLTPQQAWTLVSRTSGARGLSDHDKSSVLKLLTEARVITLVRTTIKRVIEFSDMSCNASSMAQRHSVDKIQIDCTHSHVLANSISPTSCILPHRHRYLHDVPCVRGEKDTTQNLKDNLGSIFVFAWSWRSVMPWPQIEVKLGLELHFREFKRMGVGASCRWKLTRLNQTTSFRLLSKSLLRWRSLSRIQTMNSPEELKRSARSKPSSNHCLDVLHPHTQAPLLMCSTRGWYVVLSLMFTLLVLIRNHTSYTRTLVRFVSHRGRQWCLRQAATQETRVYSGWILSRSIGKHGKRWWLRKCKSTSKQGGRFFDISAIHRWKSLNRSLTHDRQDGTREGLE